MSEVLPCTSSRACQADRTCARLPRFQARLDAAQDAQRPEIHERTEACANHLGVMVVAMSTWAREHDLVSADLTILIIEPPPCESYPRQHQYREYAQTSGLVFSIIHLDESETVPSGMCPPSQKAPIRAFQPDRYGSAAVSSCTSSCWRPVEDVDGTVMSGGVHRGSWDC